MLTPHPESRGIEAPPSALMIRSDRILRLTIFSMTAIVGLLTLGELTVEFQATEGPVIATFFGLFLLMSGLVLNKRFHPWLGVAFNLLVFVMVEYHGLRNYTTYHVINFWFVCVPVISLITTGTRSSFFWSTATITAIIVNGLVFRDIHGSFYPITIYVVPLMVGGLIFNLTVYGFSYILYRMMKEANLQMQENSRSLARLKEEADTKHARLESYIEAMNRMSRGQAVLAGDLDALFAQICESAVTKLGITRVSIWELTDEYIERKFLFEQHARQDVAFRLYQRDYPMYFQAIRTHNLVSADYAETHPDTCEFAETYLRPLGIVSMLDATFSIEDRLAGLICCENQREVRQWTAEDRLFVQSLAGLVSVGYNSYKAQAFLEQIRLQNKELHAQRLQIEEINRELKGSNETLEEHVQERTRKLEEQNAQLTEYAFINSHLLRAPLARILGLASLIVQINDENKPIDPVLMRSLLRSSEELDEIIRTISKLLYEGKDFTRKEVEEIVFRKLNPGEDLPGSDGTP